MAVQENVAQSITTRPLAEGDIAGVAALYLRQLHKPGIESADDARDLLQRTLVDDPWADDAIPSLVSAAPDGTIVGFIGSSVPTRPSRRRAPARGLRIASRGRPRLPEPDDRPVPAAYLPARAAGPDAHGYGHRPGPRALGRARQRPPASPRNRMAAASAADRRRVRHRAQPRWPARARRAGARPRRAAPRPRHRTDCGRGPIRPRRERRRGRAYPGGGARALAECARPARLVPGYDEQFLAWLFRELAVSRVRGEARFHLVRSRGAVVGWYVFYLEPGGLCRVLQVMTRERNSDLVVGELYRDAYAGGASALYGRLEPHTSEAVLRRGALLRPNSARTRAHAPQRRRGRAPARRIRAQLARRRALVTRRR